jgi:hypothetical protein
MMRGDSWGRITGTSRHKFFSITEALQAPPSDLAADTLTLRDDLAKNAPITFEQAMMLWGDEGANLNDDTTRKCFYAVWAGLRYEFADEMLAARRAKT